MREADFSERIKTILCERVGGRCSNPNCRRETLGPHREGDKRLSMGEAAHIYTFIIKLNTNSIRQDRNQV